MGSNYEKTLYYWNGIINAFFKIHSSFMYVQYVRCICQTVDVTQYDLYSKYSLGFYSYLYGMHRSSCGYNNILPVTTDQDFSALVCTVCTGKVSPLLGYT